MNSANSERPTDFRHIIDLIHFLWSVTATSMVRVACSLRP